MRRVNHAARLTAFAALVATAGSFAASAAHASSHREAPMIASDGLADNTDLYAFMSPENDGTVTLVANYVPFEEPMGGPNFFKFGEDVLYALNIDNNGDAKPDIQYTFRFSTTTQNPNTFLYNTGPITSLTDPDWNIRQTYTITRVDAGGSHVLGSNIPVPPVNIGPGSTPNYDALASAAVTTLSNGITAFAGQRDDPFFVDLGVFDLLALRAPVGDHGGGVDCLAGYNCQSIVLKIPVAQLTACGCTPSGSSDPNAVIGVWATAGRQKAMVITGGGLANGYRGPFVQVSRLGMPLVNEVVVPVGKKDLWNNSLPKDDGQFLSYVDKSELAGLLTAIYGVSVPAGPRTDLEQVFLTGVPGLNQPANVTASEQLRLNLAIPAYPLTSVMGVIGGDLGGYPNGRRLEDDVTDISLRAVAGVLVPGYNVYPNNALGDGVDQNDTAFLTAFPYVGTPHQGYAADAHNVVTPLRAGAKHTAAVKPAPQSAPAAALAKSGLLGNAPNPFAANTSVRFSLAAATPVKLEVFDIAGRKIATLADGPMAAGAHAVTWAGTDASGAKVASGLYFSRLTADGRTEQRAMMIQK